MFLTSEAHTVNSVQYVVFIYSTYISFDRAIVPTPLSSHLLFEYKIVHLKYRVMNCRCYHARAHASGLSRLTHFMLEKLNPLFLICQLSPSFGQISKSLGWFGLDNPVRTGFQSFWSNNRVSRGDDRPFWIRQLRSGTKMSPPTQHVIFLLS
jgi:hypothetical protein